MKNSAILGLLGNSAKIAIDTLDGAIPTLRADRISRTVRSEMQGKLKQGGLFISDEELIDYVSGLEPDHIVMRRMAAMRDLLAMFEVGVVATTSDIVEPMGHVKPSTPVNGETVRAISDQDRNDWGFNSKDKKGTSPWKEEEEEEKFSTDVGETVSNPFAFGAVTDPTPTLTTDFGKATDFENDDSLIPQGDDKAESVGAFDINTPAPDAPSNPFGF
jgi:hypothetical protein